jgi:hypothetical protein
MTAKNPHELLADIAAQNLSFQPSSKMVQIGNVLCSAADDDTSMIEVFDGSKILHFEFDRSDPENLSFAKVIDGRTGEITHVEPYHMTKFARYMLQSIE